MMYSDELNIYERNISDSYGECITNYDSGFICDVFSDIANSNVDIYFSDLFDWAKNNTWYIDEVQKEYGVCGGIVQQIKIAQGNYNEEKLYEMQDDILKYYAYNYLSKNEIDLCEEKLLDLENYIEHLNCNDRLDSINDFCRDLIKEEIEM